VRVTGEPTSVTIEAHQFVGVRLEDLGQPVDGHRSAAQEKSATKALRQRRRERHGWRARSGLVGAGDRHDELFGCRVEDVQGRTCARLSNTADRELELADERSYRGRFRHHHATSSFTNLCV